MFENLSNIDFVALAAFFVSVISLMKKQEEIAHNRRMVTAQKRLDEVIYPLFRIVEPYMKKRKKLSDFDAGEIDKILRQQSHLIGGKLSYYQEIFTTYKSTDYQKVEKRIEDFYSEVSKEYDVLNNEIGIPKRKWRYFFKNYRMRFSRFTMLVIGINSVAFLSMILVLGGIWFEMYRFSQNGEFSTNNLALEFFALLMIWLFQKVLFDFLDR